ncbi:TetR/AcrR family transcriptional regulator [Tardiphaga sp.]|jgi:AcrR family transcriptional regulator|uniref:TetR/AcrR family transcriptional regulator n=1 Tax=Tardiphaga sp. TaxID=1926292 RepID=UPI0037DA02C0
MSNDSETGTSITTARILDAAKSQIRRFGGQKTNIVDIAKVLGTSHTTIYRHFRSKSEVFDAIVAEAMNDERELAATFVSAAGKASDRLLGLTVALHRRKRERFVDDFEVYQLYRRVIEERPDLVRDYATAMTGLVEAILADGVRQGEFKIGDVVAAAGVVRDAVTVFIHPAHVEAAHRAGIEMEPMLRRVMAALQVAFETGIAFDGL